MGHFLVAHTKHCKKKERKVLYCRVTFFLFISAFVRVRSLSLSCISVSVKMCVCNRAHLLSSIRPCSLSIHACIHTYRETHIKCDSVLYRLLFLINKKSFFYPVLLCLHMLDLMRDLSENFLLE